MASKRQSIKKYASSLGEAQTPLVPAQAERTRPAPAIQPALRDTGRRRPGIGAVALLATLTMTACSGDDLPEHALMVPAEDLPDQVMGYVSWDDVEERKLVRRVSCRMEDSFYVMVAEGRDFVLRVGFWGEGARDIEEIDFDQADSVELRTVDEELYFYRYTILRILPEMGPVSGSVESARGTTRLRSTSTEAVVKHRSGIELDFEFSCSVPAPAQVAGS